MGAGIVVEVVRSVQERNAVRVEVLREEDLQARYDQLVALVLRMGNWLTGPHARLLPREDWCALFDRYAAHLEQLRGMGEMLRPSSLRERDEPLAGDALVSEVLELFAA